MASAMGSGDELFGSPNLMPKATKCFQTLLDIFPVQSLGVEKPLEDSILADRSPSGITLSSSLFYG